MLDRDFVFVDLETTGGRARQDFITEVAFSHVRAGEVVENWSSLVNPGVPIPSFIQGITGITDAMVSTAPSFAEIAPFLLKKLEGKIFVAHNVGFDYGFLKQAFSDEGIELELPSLCTVKLSKKLFPEYRKHSLDSLIQRFGFTCSDRHRATGDVEVLLQFWDHVCSSIAEDTLHEAFQQVIRYPSFPRREISSLS